MKWLHPEPLHMLPSSLFGYVWRFTGRHQVALAAMSIMVFALSAAPLELQRRIVNDAIAKGDVEPIVRLALAYVAVALAEGALKLAMNVYRSWVSEGAVRHLRHVTLDVAHPEGSVSAQSAGVELSMVLSEIEPIGGFVGVSTSEPLLQGGILFSVFGYMVYLEPRLALFSLLIFSPQFVFVPLLQRAINRRVESRILTTRELGAGMLRSGGHRRRHVNRVFRLQMGIFKLKFSMNFLMNLTHHAGVAAALGIGGWFALSGRIEVGTVVAFISGLAKVNDPWGDLVNWFRDMTVTLVKYRLIAGAVARMQTGLPGS